MHNSSILLAKSTLYSNHVDYNNMIEQIQNYTTASHVPIRCILFTTNVNVCEHLNKEINSGITIEKHYCHNDIYIGELFREFGRKKEKHISGKFLLFKHNKYDINLVLTDAGTPFFENGLLRFIKDQYPTFVLPFFYSWEMEIMLNNLSKSISQSKVMLTKLSRKSRIESDISNKQKESDLTWTYLPYKEVFEQTRQNDAWMEKVDFDLISELEKDGSTIQSIVLEGSISRNGIFKFSSEFKLFYKNIIEEGIEVFFKRRNQLSDRARTKETKYESKPFFIEFDEPIFKNKKQNMRLVGILKNLPHLSYSVIHMNPYLHMTITDQIDRSNYDIWVLSENKISIAPQTVCSMSALNRLCDHISRDFQEGTVKDLS